jgi:hypothetical protein
MVTIDVSKRSSTAPASSLSLYAGVAINAHSQSQVWTLSRSRRRPQFGNSCGFSVSSLQSGLSGRSSLLGYGDYDNWRVFRVPSASSETWNRYLFYEEKAGAYLSLDRTTGAISLEKFSLDATLLSIFSNNDQNSAILRRITWKLMPWTQDVPEAPHQLAWPGKQQLFLARATVANSAPLLAKEDPRDTAQWWNIKSRVTDDGSIAYDVYNFLSNELLEPSTDGLLVGATTKLGSLVLEPTGQSCVLSPAAQPSMVIGVGSDQKINLQPLNIATRWQLLQGSPKVDHSQADPTILTKEKALSLTTWEKPRPGLPVIQADPAKPKPPSLLKPLDDGIYFIYNELTKRQIGLAGPEVSQTVDEIGADTQVQMKPSDPKAASALSSIWQISRLHDYQGLVYVVRSYTTGLLLTENLDTALGADGRQCSLTRYNAADPSHLWVINPQTTFSYSFVSGAGAASLEDLSSLSTGSSNDVPRATPSLDTKPSQRWKLVSAPRPITSGVYRLRFQSGNLLRCGLNQNMQDTSLTSNSSTWRVSVRPDGFFSIEPLITPSLYFLNLDEQKQWFSSQDGEEESAAWKLLPAGDTLKGFYVQSALSEATITESGATPIRVVNSHGKVSSTHYTNASLTSRSLASPHQLVTFEESPDEVPSVSNYDSIPTSKVLPGIYRIGTWHQTYLTLEDSIQSKPPNLPKSRRQAINASISPSNPQNFQWRIESSGNGFYKITHSSDLLLCQALGIAESAMWPYTPSYPSQPDKSWAAGSDTRQWASTDVCGVVPEYDATRWKLIHVDGLRFQIVNKTSGNALQIDGSNPTVTLRGDTPIPGAAAWTLELVQTIPQATDLLIGSLTPAIDPVTLDKKVQSRSAYTRRELDIASGIFIITHDAISPMPQNLTFREQRVLPRPGGLSMIQSVNPELAPADLDAYSLDRALQYWTLVKDDDGWYSVSNYLYGYQLAAVPPQVGGRRAFPSNPPGLSLCSPISSSTADKATLQWRFIQANGRVSMACRACDEYVVTVDGPNMRFRRPSERASAW